MITAIKLLFFFLLSVIETVLSAWETLCRVWRNYHREAASRSDFPILACAYSFAPGGEAENITTDAKKYLCRGSPTCRGLSRYLWGGWRDRTVSFVFFLRPKPPLENQNTVLVVSVHLLSATIVYPERSLIPFGALSIQSLLQAAKYPLGA